jgi:hypothetical protein
MSSGAVEAIRAHAAQLCRKGVPPLPALLAGVEHVQNELFLPVGDERVPWTLAEAASGQRRVVVDVAGSKWRNAGGAPVVSPDESEVTMTLQHDGTKAPTIGRAGTVLVSVDNADAVRYDYDLAEGVTPATGDVWAFELPLQGSETQRADGLALVALVLRGVSKPGDAARLSGVELRVQLRKVRRAAATLPSNAAALEAPVPAPPTAPRLNPAEQAAARKAAFGADDVGDKDTLVVRAGNRALYESGPDTAESLGGASRALTAAAVVQAALAASPNATGGTVLADRTLVARMLGAAGAPNVRDAFLAIYKRAGYETPSLAELLSDSSGLPAYVPHTTARQHAMIADAGGDKASGDLEKDFAAALAVATPLAEPGAVYNPSPLGWAVLLFALPGGERSDALARTMTAMARGEHAGTISWPAAPGEPGYQSVYKLWGGMRASAGALAHMLAHPGWFGGSSAHVELGWLHALLRVRVPAGPLGAACGGWLHTRTADGHHVVATCGTHERTTTVLTLMPALGVSGVLVVRSGSPLPAQRYTDCMARFMAALVGVREPTGVYEPMPAPVRVRRAAERSATLTTASSSPTLQLPELTRKFAGRFVALNEPNMALTLALEMAPPSPAALRYVLTLERGAERTKFVLVYDPEAPPNPADVSGTPGAMRLVDPKTHAVTEYVYFDMVEGAGGRIEPLIYVLGRVFGREGMADEMRAFFDSTSDVAFRRRAALEAARKEQRAAAAAARAEKKRMRASVLRDGDQSDDDEDEAASDGEAADDDDNDVVIIAADMFDALAGAAGGGARTQYGRWHSYIGTERNRAAALLHAYPAGERTYPLGAWTSGPTMAFYD